MGSHSAPPGAWKQPSPRAEMLVEVRALDLAARALRLTIAHCRHGHVDDEVVATLALEARRAGDVRAENEFASVLLKRITKQVKAHVRKNRAWQDLGGGADVATEDFSQSIALGIFADKKVPCHAEVAFGDYVWKRSLDEAGKLFAKKHSAGQTLDENAEAEAQEGDSDVAPAVSMSPEALLMTLQEEADEAAVLERIREIVQSEEMPELAKIAFTYRFYGQLQIESKKEDVITITKLMGITDKTVTKYIDEAIALIRKGFDL